MNKHTRVLNVDGGIDYRLRTLKQVEIFHSPLDESAETSLETSFNRLAPDLEEAEEHYALDVLGRNIHVRRICEDVAWFDFKAVCDGPRSQNDYIEIARCFHAVLISGVPVFHGKNDDMARRFINMVDEFYDRQVKLLMTAEAPIEQLYQDGRLGFEFQRTISRLQEMQSEDYLARAHRG